MSYPGFPFIFNGICLIIVGILGIIFRDKYGQWSADYRKRLAERFPAWKRLSGLPDDKLKYYFSLDFNRRMIVAGGVILIVVGIILTGIGFIK